ncbi:uncharacterized protein LY89DRAFT_367817 [Mollisia scopiformis]|uniref:Uncharacterized protein n=1 Tax=Mollisia scopiformis TaxID=149040 RepID=A0A132B429_MOLSC|nr:uncharacterized protein LY89DRAFT_367817 [Mollisia scopiformis]KUJ07091.1 hypothetical protein LY89DRAFT_367817 [Mollisia scopiformis]
MESIMWVHLLNLKFVINMHLKYTCLHPNSKLVMNLGQGSKRPMRLFSSPFPSPFSSSSSSSRAGQGTFCTSAPRVIIIDECICFFGIPRNARRQLVLLVTAQHDARPLSGCPFNRCCNPSILRSSSLPATFSSFTSNLNLLLPPLYGRRALN